MGKKTVVSLLAISLLTFALMGCKVTKTETSTTSHTDADGNTVTTTTTTTNTNGDVSTETTTTETKAEETIEYSVGLVNKTDYTVAEAYIFIDGEDYTGNYLTEGIGPQAGKADILGLKLPESMEYVDLKYVLDDGNELYFENYYIAGLGTAGRTIPQLYEDEEGFLLGLCYYADLVIYNDTDFDFAEMYCSSSNSEYWSNNLLDKVFPAGGSFNGNFTYSNCEYVWDFKFVDENGDDITYNNIDFSQLNNPESISITVFCGEEEGQYTFHIE